VAFDEFVNSLKPELKKTAIGLIKKCIDDGTMEEYS